MEKYGNIKTIYIFIFARYILYRLICRSFFFTFSHYIISIWITNPYYIRLHDCWFVGYQHWEHCDAEMICRNVAPYTWSNFVWFYEIIWSRNENIVDKNSWYILNVTWILQSCWEHSYLLQILFSWKELELLKLHWLILKQILEVKSICSLSMRYPPRRSTP